MSSLRLLPFLALAAVPLTAQELTTPANWRYSLDRSAALLWSTAGR